MQRSRLLMMGSKPARRVPNYPFLHASQRPAESAELNYSELNPKLKYPVNPSLVESSLADPFKYTPPANATSNLPFVVERTSYGKALPVYTDYKGGRTKIVTILRKIKGDVEELKTELEAVTGREVVVRAGKLVVTGNFRDRVARYLTGLGF